MREMKDSGTIWLGTIPVNWDIARIGSFYKLRNTKVSDTDYPPLSVTNRGVVPQLETAAKTNAHDDRKLVKKGDFAINSRSDRRGSCGIAPCDGSVSLINTILSPMGEMNPRYYDWLFHTIEFGDEFYKCGHGIVDDLWTTGWQDMKKILIPYPSLAEQEKIANFLDSKCSEIDAISVDIQKEIETLEQYKRSVITETVTKGLNPDVEMKDSGLRWCEKIPATWEVIPAKYLFHNSDTRKFPNDELLTASQKYGLISQTDYMKRENAKIVLANAGIENWKHVEPNDFVISLRSFQGGLEMSEISGCVTWHYVVLRAAQKVFQRYYKWLFKSSKYINALQATCNFIRDGQDLRFSNFAKVPLFIPPYKEQCEIAAYLDEKTTAIDAVMQSKKKQLEVLDSYKKSLIYEYVTGKKEVVQ